MIEEVNNKDLELDNAIDELREILNRRGYVFIGVISPGDPNVPNRLIETWPRWSAVQVGQGGHTALPRNFKEGMDPTRTVNTAGNMAQFLSGLAGNIMQAVNNVVNIHKVILTSTNPPQPYVKAGTKGKH